ncbi:DUF58 domain-containing protein [Halobacteriales archaeon QH_10_67_22]|nr:MAG: DUF58 domain-containing protein [Halobacteriales archaeon QH_10_67_22]
MDGRPGGGGVSRRSRRPRPASGRAGQTLAGTRARTRATYRPDGRGARSPRPRRLAPWGCGVTDARRPRWRVGAVAALSLVALGFLYTSPLLLVATLVPLGYVLSGGLSTVPSDAAVRVERTVHDARPTPGERVRVTLSVTNDGEATLPDVRVVDGVPAELTVTGGPPRLNATLRPGESATVTYTLVARRGEFAFDPAVVRIRSLAGSAVRTETVAVAGDATVACLSPLSDRELGSVTPLRAGTHPTDSGGPGVEFHATREYRPGDPRTRIHWRRFAKTGDLRTVSFREERAVSTVLVVDARPVGRVSPRPGVPTGADLCGYAGERLYESLTGAGVVTSVTALGLEDEQVPVPVRPGGFPWADGDTAETTEATRAVFAAVRAVSGTRYEDDTDDATSTSPVGTAVTAGGGNAHSTADGGVGGRTDGETTETRTDARTDDGTAEHTPTSDPDDSRDPTEPEDGHDPTDSAASHGSTGFDGHGSGGFDSEDAEGLSPEAASERELLLLAALPASARVLVVTPLLDDRPSSLVRTLRSQEYPVTVLTPDVTGTGSVGGRVAAAERRLRRRDLEAAGATTVEWTPGDALDVALADAVAHLVGGER